MRNVGQKFKDRNMELFPAVCADIPVCYNGSGETGMLQHQTDTLLCGITHNAITNDRMLASHQKFKEQQTSFQLSLLITSYAPVYLSSNGDAACQQRSPGGLGIEYIKANDTNVATQCNLTFRNCNKTNKKFSQAGLCGVGAGHEGT